MRKFIGLLFTIFFSIAPAYADGLVGAPVLTDSAAWSAYTPTIGVTSGALTGSTVNTAKYKLIGKTLFLTVDITITDVGTGTGDITFTLPNSATIASPTSLSGSEFVVFGGYGVYATNTAVGSTYLLLQYINGNTSAATGARFVVEGVVEIQ